MPRNKGARRQVGRIEARGLCKSFGDLDVIRDLSFDIEPGEIVRILGASGSGKTTLLMLLMGLISPDAGELGGVPARIGAVFQSELLVEHWNALENLRLVRSRDAVDAPPGETDAKLADLLAELGLGEDTARPVSEFSGGMKRRVSIARALCVHPDLLVLDEPFTGLDDEARASAAATILAHRGKATIVLTTHDDLEAELLGVTRQIAL